MPLMVTFLPMAAAVAISPDQPARTPISEMWPPSFEAKIDWFIVPAPPLSTPASPPPRAPRRPAVAHFFFFFIDGGGGGPPPPFLGGAFSGPGEEVEITVAPI